jgi:hypothetical protein
MTNPSSSSLPEKNDSFDFVLIEADEGIFHENFMMMDHGSDDDDDSYDYCEDACSMFSHGEDSSSASGLLMDMKESVLSVPDVLMKDLDEAHAAAKLVQFDDDAAPQEGYSSFTTSSSAKKSDHYSSASSVVSMDEDDDEDSSSPKNVRSNDSSIFHAAKKDGIMDEEMIPSLPPPAPSILATKDLENHPGKASGATDLSATAKEGASSISRTSNKKRRKKLKMLKKAQAAASAAIKLAENDQPTGSAKKSKATLQPNQATQKAKSRLSKKASNIAVACATETMAAYREELMLRGIK